MSHNQFPSLVNRIQKHSLSLWSTIDEIDFYRMIEPLIACLRVGLCSQLLRVPEESFKLYSAMFSYYREFRRFRPNSVLFVDRLTPPPCQMYSIYKHLHYRDAYLLVKSRKFLAFLAARRNTWRTPRLPEDIFCCLSFTTSHCAYASVKHSFIRFE